MHPGSIDATQSERGVHPRFATEIPEIATSNPRHAKPGVDEQLGLARELPSRREVDDGLLRPLFYSVSAFPPSPRTSDP
jgi:hypothetical protein